MRKQEAKPKPRAGELQFTVQERVSLTPAQLPIVAPCGSVDCNGCYEVEPGVKIHPPRSGKWRPKK